MTFLQTLFHRDQVADDGASSALLHYVRQTGDEKARIHLRLDPTGDGTLIVNANRIFHLNPTAALMARMMLDGGADTEIAGAVRRRYRVPTATLLADVADFRPRLE